MFFFIAGIQPKTVYLEDKPRRCPSCGLFQAYLKRVDHYVSVFFIPLFRVKKGEAIIECRGCGSLSHESGTGPREISPNKCPYCGKVHESAFRFCPHCGKRIT
jgi:rubrerythrin